MMKKKLMLISALFFMLSFNHAKAFDDWDKIDYTLLGTSTILQIVDWRQTLYISSNPDQYYEMNPILGEHPNTNDVNMYFAGSFLIRLGVAYVLPSGWRKAWLGGLTILSGTAVVHNNNIGIEIKW